MRTCYTREKVQKSKINSAFTYLFKNMNLRQEIGVRKRFGKENKHV